MNKNKICLSKANLEGANLSKTNLSRANLEGANLNGANLERAKLFGTTFIHKNTTALTACFKNTQGIDKDEEAFLRTKGAIFE